MRFEEYAAEQGQPLLRLAYVLTGDSQLAEDITQTALTSAFRNWRRVTRARNPDAYVRRMLVNAHLDWCRKRSSSEQLVGELPPPSMPAPDHADQVASRDHTRALLAALAPRARAVLVLRYYADLDDHAIAQTMGVTSSSVRATASRALATLRESGAAQPEEHK